MSEGRRIEGIRALILVLAGVAAPARAQERRPFAWNHYHDQQEIRAFLEEVTRAHPGLARLSVIGRSRQGRPIRAVEINNPQTGPPREKPGFYIDGNIHGGEVLAGEGALFMVAYLLNGHAHDPEIRKLVDRSAIYIVPIVNPDGREISITTKEDHRWNARPLDLDGDGRQDEDPPEDLDGDGQILRMRVPDPHGRFKISARDPRLMLRRRPGEAGTRFFRLYREGIDNDQDGRFNEDPVGGVDLNRNFPSNWSGAQFGSGPFPLSEPETHALVEFITDRPNIAAIHTFHTSGGMILRFPTLADQEGGFPAADLADYREIGRVGAAITGYANYARDKATIVNLMHPGHGVFNDWASKVFGVLAITTEMWRHPFGAGEALQWNDQKLGGEGFVAWHPFQHPQLGPVELGGWKRAALQNPPEREIAGELERNARWVLTFASRLPRLAIDELRARPIPGSKTRFAVQATVSNQGWMPTATAQAVEVLHTAKPARARLSLENARLLAGTREVSLGILPGRRKADPEATRTLAWEVELRDPRRPAHVLLEARSQKAGTRRRRIALGPGK